VRVEPVSVENNRASPVWRFHDVTDGLDDGVDSAEVLGHRVGDQS
jgi:hypothetical protein